MLWRRRGIWSSWSLTTAGTSCCLVGGLYALAEEGDLVLVMVIDNRGNVMLPGRKD